MSLVEPPSDTISINARANANPSPSPGTMSLDSTPAGWKKSAPPETPDWDDTLGAGNSGAGLKTPSSIPMGDPNAGNSG